MTFLPRVAGVAEAATWADGVPQATTVSVDGVPMSALVAFAPRPRGVVVALHGGASTSVYWDCPGHPDLSLLRRAVTLGWSVVAVDRPGYGSSYPRDAELAPAERRVRLTFGAVDALLAGRPRGAGLVVLGHSIGCELALRLAGEGRDDVLGLALAGTGEEGQPVSRQFLETGDRDSTELAKPSQLRALLWEPAELYPGDVVGGASIGSRSPRYEGDVVRGWTTGGFAALAARVRVPVHYVLGDHERVWRNDPPAMADVAARFTAAPRVVVDRQVRGGHNLSVCRTATAYHLKVLSFAEECAEGES